MNTTTRAQRINKRYEKIWQRYDEASGQKLYQPKPGEKMVIVGPKDFADSICELGDGPITKFADKIIESIRQRDHLNPKQKATQ